MRCVSARSREAAAPSALSIRTLSMRCVSARSREAAAPSAVSIRTLSIRCVFSRCITAFLPSSKRRDEAAGAAVTAEARGTGGAEDLPAAAVSRDPVSYHEATRAASNCVTQTNSAKPTDRMKKEVRREMSNWIRDCSSKSDFVIRRGGPNYIDYMVKGDSDTRLHSFGPFMGHVMVVPPKSDLLQLGLTMGLTPLTEPHPPHGSTHVLTEHSRAQGACRGAGPSAARYTQHVASGGRHNMSSDGSVGECAPTYW